MWSSLERAEGKATTLALAILGQNANVTLITSIGRTVTDAEPKAITLALQHHRPPNNITICSDSRAALGTCRGIGRGAPCRSGIEKELKQALQHLERQGVKVYLVWVRAHIGIEGNEQADRTANRFSWQGDIGNLPQSTTPAGLRQNSKALRKDWRTEPPYPHKNNTATEPWQHTLG